MRVLVIGLLFVLAACGPGGSGLAPSEAPTATIRVAPSPVPTAVPTSTTTPQPTTSPTTVAEPPLGAQSARQVLAQILQTKFEDVKIVRVEPVDWPTTCLGVTTAGETCETRVVPGYRVVLEARGERYELHTDRDGGMTKVASAPKIDVPNAGVVWRGPETRCQTATISAAVVAVGPCGGPLVPGQLVEKRRAEDLAYFIQTYAAFEASTPAGRVTFNGQGTTTATAAEQRMIAEWARLVAQEASMGRSGASWGLALVWHRQGGVAGFCDDLSVYRTGEAYATSCKGGQTRNLGRGRLTPAQLEKLYQWIDALQAFEDTTKDRAPVDSMTVRVLFTGDGQRAPTTAEIQAIQEFAALVWVKARS